MLIKILSVSLTFRCLVVNDFALSDLHRLLLIPKLRLSSVKPYLLLLQYCSIIESIILYCVTCYFTMLSCTNRNELFKITNSSSKIIGLSTPNLSAPIDTAIIHRKKYYSKKPYSRPLNSCFNLLPSGRRSTVTPQIKHALGKVLYPRPLEC